MAVKRIKTHGGARMPLVLRKTMEQSLAEQGQQYSDERTALLAQLGQCDQSRQQGLAVLRNVAKQLTMVANAVIGYVREHEPANTPAPAVPLLQVVAASATPPTEDGTYAVDVLLREGATARYLVDGTGDPLPVDNGRIVVWMNEHRTRELIVIADDASGQETSRFTTTVPRGNPVTE